jgi:plasmanylethanolamine desaturase
LTASLGLRWWAPFVALAGAVFADFVSGVVHWTADTWGRETMPILGRRFLRPFRVHHVNPDDFLRRDFIDCNGDVAMVVIPFLTAAWFIPLHLLSGQIAAVFLVAFCSAGLPTNQVHQWAHMRRPPRWVRQLQDWGLILSRREHQRHHAPPYVQNYCIAAGWCNRPLTAIDFFRRIERILTRVTGWQSRSDDKAFQMGVEASLSHHDSTHGRGHV